MLSVNILRLSLSHQWICNDFISHLKVVDTLFEVAHVCKIGINFGTLWVCKVLVEQDAVVVTMFEILNSKNLYTS